MVFDDDELNERIYVTICFLNLCFDSLWRRQELEIEACQHNNDMTETKERSFVPRFKHSIASLSENERGKINPREREISRRSEREWEVGVEPWGTIVLQLRCCCCCQLFLKHPYSFWTHIYSLPPTRLRRIITFKRYAESPWCQFHQHFMNSFFVLKCFAKFLCAPSLGLTFFVEMKLAQNLLLCEMLMKATTGVNFTNIL